MSSPISVHNITSVDNLPEIKDYTLTLKFKLQSDGELDHTELAKMLQYVLQDWPDARYSFDTEMVTTGLARCLRMAVRCMVDKEAQDEFGRELVPHADGMGDTSKWYLESEANFAKQKKPWISSEPEVEII